MGTWTKSEQPRAAHAYHTRGRNVMLIETPMSGPDPRSGPPMREAMPGYFAKPGIGFAVWKSMKITIEFLE